MNFVDAMAEVVMGLQFRQVAVRLMAVAQHVRVAQFLGELLQSGCRPARVFAR